MDFVPAVKHVLVGNYANFQGRAPRSEFWWFVLFLILAEIGLAILLSILGVVLGSDGSTFGSLCGLLYGVFVLGLFLPHLAVTVRRLHDTDRSGWWILLGFLPILGAILLLIWYCTKGSYGPNRFGNEPLVAS